LLDSLIELTFHKGLKGLATLACVFHFDTIRQSWTENAAVTVYDLRFTFQLNVDRSLPLFLTAYYYHAARSIPYSNDRLKRHDSTASCPKKEHSLIN